MTRPDPERVHLTNLPEYAIKWIVVLQLQKKMFRPDVVNVGNILSWKMCHTLSLTEYICKLKYHSEQQPQKCKSEEVAVRTKQLLCN